MQGTTGNAGHAAERLVEVERGHDELRSLLETLKNQVLAILNQILFNFIRFTRVCYLVIATCAQKTRRPALLELKFREGLLFFLYERDIMQGSTWNAGHAAERLMEIERANDELRSQLETLKNQVLRAK